MLKVQSKWQNREFDLVLLALLSFCSRSNHKPYFLYNAALAHGSKHRKERYSWL